MPPARKLVSKKAFGTEGLLNRILGEPKFVALIQSLEPRVLSQLIRHVGLEDSGEIIALATVDQLKKIFDDDLWRSTQPGAEEKFDAERFGLWLQIMLEMGTEFAAEKLIEMDEEFLTLAFSHQILVVDLEELTLRYSNRGQRGFGDDDLAEKALETSLNHEFEKYSVISRNQESWEAVLSVLIALDEYHHDFLRNFLDRCCYLSSEYIEDNGGLYEVLTAEEQLASDVAFEREQRREKEGFVPAQTAAAFLRLARGPVASEDHVSPSYFKNIRNSAAKGDVPALSALNSEKGIQENQGLPQLLHLLQEAQVLGPSEHTLLLENANRTEPGGQRDDKHKWIAAALANLQDGNPILFSQRMSELSYLANVLISGCSYGGRAFRPAEAAKAVLATCNLGFENQDPTQDFFSRDALQVFREGWSLLYREVSLASAKKLEEILSSFVKGPHRSGQDLWIEKQVAEGVASLKKGIASGTPWIAIEKLDILETILDADVLNTLTSLISECPTYQGEFISSRAQVDAVVTFLRKIESSLQKI